MRTLFFWLLFWLIACGAPPPGGTPIEEEILLWPEGAPGVAALAGPELVVDRAPEGGPCYLNRKVSQVTRPGLQAFLPAVPNGKAVLLCPGGGYAHLAYDKEGTTLAAWFNAQGIAAFVLKYRLPKDGHRLRQYAPLQDAQRAMRYLKAHAAEYGISPDSIGVMGGSAGGHLAATLSVHYDWEAYDPRDEMDRFSARPAFSILMYPVISFQDSLAHRGSRRNLLGEPFSPALRDSLSPELHVDAETPPAFLFHARSDSSVSYRNSVAYARALEQAGVKYALQLYPDGRHGMSRCEAGTSSFARWPQDLLQGLAGLDQ